MAAGEGKGDEDFYARLGLKKECSSIELRKAYKKLALRWHPDRCPASGNSKYVDEAKEKFQSIQEAYTVLSDTNKRFLYDVGIYESDEDDNMQGMTDFLGEMATMMSQENGGESFEELQVLFEEMCHKEHHHPQPYTSSSSTAFVSVNENPMETKSCQNWTWDAPTASNLNKRNSWDMSSSNANDKNASKQSSFNPIHRTFSLGTEGDSKNKSRQNGRRRGGRNEANCL